MTPQRARTVSNVILSVAAAAIAYSVARMPSARRTLWRAAKVALSTTLPAYLAREAGRAWVESGRRA